MLRRTLSRLACVVLASLSTAPAFAQSTAPAPAPGIYTLPTSVPFLQGSTTYRLGGFSGLHYIGGNEFWTITDRGPNVDSGSAKVFPVPGFQPMMVMFRANADGSLELLRTMPIRRTGGGAISGLPNPGLYNTGERALDTTFNLLGTDDWGYDTEGIVRAADGTFWMCDEYGPGIAQLTMDGEILRRVRPQPTGGLPDILRKRVANRGAEGIAVTPNGKVYTIVQSGMANSYANTSSANSAAANGTELLRLVEYDPMTGQSRMFAYMMDAGYPVSGSDIRRRDIKIGDMVALNNNELLLIEHAQRGAVNAKKIYKVNLSDATPITMEVFQTSPGVFKTLEELTRAEVMSIAGITPVAKTLVIDLLDGGAGNPIWPLDADKPEGLTMLDPWTIAVTNDNDFGVLSPNADGKITLTGSRSRLFVYRLSSKLDYQSPAQGPATRPSVGQYAVPPVTAPFLPTSPTYHLGGFSGLQYLGGDEFLTITDRGPNVDSGDVKVFLVPDFRPMILRIRANANGAISILGTLPITKPGGGAISGLPTPASYAKGERALDTNFNLAPSDDWGFDSEGIVIAPDGTYWFCDEYGPTIAQVSSTGEILRRVSPQPTGGLPQVLSKRVSNRGAEGIAITPNGKVYTIVQSGMANSYANTSSANTAAANNTELLRLVEYDPATGAMRMFAYMIDSYPVSGSDIIRRRDIKIGDMVALNNSELLLIEHAQRGPQNAKKIYKVNLAGATPITSEVYQPTTGTFRSLEELTRAQVTSVAGITPVTKTLVLDLLNPGPGNPTWPLDADKPEGLAMIDPGTIALGNDNDFGVLSPNADGRAILTGSRSRIFIYKLQTPLDYQTGARATFTSNAADLNATPALFDNVKTCVGEGIVSVPVTVTNSGRGPLTIYGVDIFRTDSTAGPDGVRNRLLRDANGHVVRSSEYMLTSAPATLPLHSNTPVSFPAYLPQGASITVYANFAGTRPDRRFARALVRTDATNFSAEDTTGVKEWGIFGLDLLGRGLAGTLSGDQTGAPLQPMVFPVTDVGQKNEMVLPIVNTGSCNLQISKKFFEITSGDVEDFTLLSAFAGVPVDPSTGNFVLMPGNATSIAVRFTPKRSGSRRATIWFRSNDSAIGIPGVSEQGSLYVDLYGVGRVQLTAAGAPFGAAAMGRDMLKNTFRIANESRESVTITSLAIAGADASEFVQGSWPATPLVLAPGGTIDLDVTFQPAAAGTPGPRTAAIIGVTSTGDTVRAELTGIAGTRIITVSPKSLFTNTTLPSGNMVREMTMITNIGTMLVKVSALTVTGTDAINYSVGMLSDGTIYPGGTALVNVTFSPTKAGPSQAILVIANDASTLDTVTLGGTGSKAMRGNDGLTGGPGSQIWEATDAAAPGAISGVGGSAMQADAFSTVLFDAVPSPATDRVTITYRLASRHQISLELFDGMGRLVRTIAGGSRDAGRHAETMDVAGLPAGTYQYRLRAGQDVLSRTLIVVR